MNEERVVLGNDRGMEPGLAANLAKEYFGGFVRSRETYGTTQAAAVQIVENNPDRIGLEVINNSDAVIYVGRNPDVSITQGIPLSAAGGAMIKKFRDDGQTCGDAVYGMSAVAGEEYTIIETILWGK